MAASTRGARFSVREARLLVHDLFVPIPAIYWVDFLASTTVGYTFGALYLAAPLSAGKFAYLAVSSLALFRVGSFIHEIVHMHRGKCLGFKTAWNVLCGIPMLMPSFFYENHVDHHNSHSYGTPRDGEYLPFGAGSAWGVLAYFAQALLLPLMVFLRFLVLTPISFVHPRLRQWTLERASFLGINPHYRLTIPDSAPRLAWALTEWACCLRAATMLGLVVVGTYHWTRLPQLYLLSVTIIGLNYLRNVVAHRYRSPGDRLSHVEQLADSINITGRGLGTELLFPLGLRYHALHHLFPGIPYHNLGKAHRRLLAELPADSVYRETVYPTFWSAVREMWSHLDRPSPKRAGSRRIDRPARQTVRRPAHAWLGRRRKLESRL